MSLPLNISKNVESAKTAAKVKVVAEQICYKVQIWPDGPLSQHVQQRSIDCCTQGRAICNK